MELITNISSITKGYNFAKNLKKGFITNCFITSDKFDKIINKKILYEIIIDEVVYLLKKDKSFYNLYFYAASIESLNKSLPKLLSKLTDLTFVVDLVSKSEICKEKLVFENNNFSLYTSLVRMNTTNVFNNSARDIKKNIRSANLNEADLILKLLTTYFDPKAEQLPDFDDIVSWINNDNIILFETNNIVVGFIIYDLKGKTLILRYWFVDPLYRDLKIGSQLFKEFLNRGEDSQRKLFWVIRSNENAIKRYIHYGFVEEKMYNFVLINNNEKYGN